LLFLLSDNIGRELTCNTRRTGILDLWDIGLDLTRLWGKEVREVVEEDFNVMIQKFGVFLCAALAKPG
jgi:hypothetical protein